MRKTLEEVAAESYWLRQNQELEEQLGWIEDKPGLVLSDFLIAIVVFLAFIFGGAF